MGVIKEFTEGTHLVGTCKPSGLWPKQISLATMTVDELFNTAAKEREAHSHLRTGVSDKDVQSGVWQQTFKEVEPGALRGPTEVAHIPSSYPNPLSRRFGVQ